MLIVDKIYSRIEMAERFLLLLNINITKPNVKCFFFLCLHALCMPLFLYTNNIINEQTRI